ncbi:MAG: 50S ribosomal protein L25/general stress protein Ctc [Rhizobiales bacterium]|nr:50S ribosomal protein L25/general stress protein Ctc [Hyphomicrobiales bacterium]
MSKIVNLKATARGQGGKGASRAVRREGRVPAVVYGDKKEPQMVSLAYNELQPHVQSGRFLSTLIDLEIEGATVRAIPRDIQFEPVRDFITHVDFLRLGKNARIAVAIPVHFKNQEICPGIKKGGVLNIVSHELELYCPADFIPDDIVIDLANLEMNKSVHIGDVQLPANVTPVSRDRDLTIATITAPGGVQEGETIAAEGAAPAAEVPATAQKAPAAAPAAAAGGKDAKAAPAAAAGGKDAKAAPAPAAKGGEKKK